MLATLKRNIKTFFNIDTKKSISYTNNQNDQSDLYKALFGDNKEAVYNYLIKESWLIYSAISLIIGAINDLPIRLIEQSNGKDREIENDPLLTLLKTRVNDSYTGRAFLQHLAIDSLLQGCFYVLPIMASNKRPLELHRFPQSCVTVKYNNSIMDQIKHFEVTDLNGSLKIIPKEDFIYQFAFNPISKQTKPFSIMNSISTSVALDLTISKWNLELVKSGGRNNVAVTTEDGLNQEVRELIKDKLKQKLEPLILEGGLKPVQLSQIKTDLDYGSAQKECLRKVATAFNIDPVLLGDPDNRTYDNMATAELRLYTKTVIPLLNSVLIELSNYFYDIKENSFKRLEVDNLKVPIILEGMLKNAEKVNNLDCFTIQEKRTLLGQAPLKDEELNKIILVSAGKTTLTDIAYIQDDQEL